MKVDYVVNANNSAPDYNKNGFYKEELLPGKNVADIKFYRCSLKTGHSLSPDLSPDKIVILVFNGKSGYINADDELFRITEPAVFAPDFDRTPYTVHALEDIEFILGVFGMNAWDKEFYKGWHLHFPFFSPYSDGVQYDQDCKLPGTKSWSIIQPFQIGHISIGFVRAVGGGTDEGEKAHPILHQWNYCLGNSDFELTVGNDAPIPQRPGDWSFIPAGKGHKLVASAGKEIFYAWIEHFVEEDIQKYYLAQIFNGSLNEVK